ncbi:MAG: acetate kinase [Candidatus Cloacimonadota bacterium]|nr:acetate kinase [Candidatus Cloacimonadota bacterium]
MKILVLNCGSSSIKYQFIKTSTKNVMAKGLIERIGEEISYLTYKTKDYKKKGVQLLAKNHTQAIELIFKELRHKEHGVIKNRDDIDAIGHRLVHGGEEFSGSVKINDNVLQTMYDCVELAPLHNPHNIKGVEACKDILPGIPQCGVFDTAFHTTLPPKAFLYGIPLEYYSKHKIRRYGFHGTSHLYVAQKAAEYLKGDFSKMKFITCHLGNGASITAIRNGQSMDTSMGFTPLEGLLMGTRCGDIDPAIPLFLQDKFNISSKEVNHILNKKSGILGLSELSNDMRVIEDEFAEGNEKAILALSVYAYRIKKYIGSYFAVLNGVDAVIFTGGVGEKMPILREMVLKDMEAIGIEIDHEKNDIKSDEILDFTGEESKVKLLKIPTNEELMIALETEKILRK